MESSMCKSDQPGRKGWLMTKKITSNMTRGGLDAGRWVDDSRVQTTAPQHGGNQPWRRRRTKPHLHPLTVMISRFQFSPLDSCLGVSDRSLWTSPGPALRTHLSLLFVKRATVDGDHDHPVLSDWYDSAPPAEFQ